MFPRNGSFFANRRAKPIFRSLSWGAVGLLALGQIALADTTQGVDNSATASDAGELAGTGANPNGGFNTVQNGSNGTTEIQAGDGSSDTTETSNSGTVGSGTTNSSASDGSVAPADATSQAYGSGGATLSNTAPAGQTPQASLSNPNSYGAAGAAQGTTASAESAAAPQDSTSPYSPAAASDYGNTTTGDNGVQTDEDGLSDLASSQNTPSNVSSTGSGAAQDNGGPSPASAGLATASGPVAPLPLPPDPNATDAPAAQTPSTPPAAATAATTPSNGNGNGNGNGNNDNNNNGNSPVTYTSADNTDPCPASEAISTKYSCKGARSDTQMAQGLNAVTQMVGSQVTNTMGQVYSQQAIEQDTPSSAYSSAAQEMQMTAYTQGAAGAVNMGMAALQIYDATNHDAEASTMTAASKDYKQVTLATPVSQSTNQSPSNTNNNLQSTAQNVLKSANTQTLTNEMDNSSDANAINTAKGQAGNVQQLIISNGVLPNGTTINGGLQSRDQVTQVQGFSTSNAATATNQVVNRIKQEDNRLNDYQSQVNKTAKNAASEQNQQFNQSLEGGIMSGVMGVMELGQAYMEDMAAQQANNLAQQLQATQAQNGFTLQAGSINGGATAPGAGTTAVSPGSVTDPSLNLANNPAPGGGPGNLTPLINPDPSSGGPAMASLPGGDGGAPQQPNSAAPGDAGMGALGTSPANDPTPNQNPTLAQNYGNTSYNPGGSYVGGGGAGGGAKGPDLSFLANLLPKQNEKDTTPKNILDFGNRSPASEPNSIMGRDANLFKRISERMAAKNREGMI